MSKHGGGDLKPAVLNIEGASSLTKPFIGMGHSNGFRSENPWGGGLPLKYRRRNIGYRDTGLLDGPNMWRKTSCMKNPRAKEWQDKTGGYLGVTLQFDCLPSYNAIPSDRKNMPEWYSDMKIMAQAASIQIELVAPAVISASELVMESTHPSIFCAGPQSTYLQVELFSTSGNINKFKRYTDDGGLYTFDCKKTDTSCTIPLVPPVKTNHFRLKLICLGASNGGDHGFADTGKLGKSLMVNFGVRTKMTEFEFTPVVKDELSQILLSSPRVINCPAILSSCVLDAHYAKWKMNEYGKFAQTPGVDDHPISLQLHQEIWNLTVSKKRLVTPSESVIEKRMVCISRPKKSKECCVAKQLLQMLDNSTAKNKLAQARLENF